MPPPRSARGVDDPPRHAAIIRNRDAALDIELEAEEGGVVDVIGTSLDR
jgi:hypothetical protein